MAEARHFPGANFVFTAPEGRNDVVDLFVFRQPDGPCNVSCWHLSADEIEEIVRTGTVWLSTLSGRNFAPAFVGSETTARRLVSQYGPEW